MAVLTEEQIFKQYLPLLYQHMLVAILTWEKLTFEDRQRVRELVIENNKYFPKKT